MISDFDPAEYSDRYEFRKGKVWSRRFKRFVTPNTRPNSKGRGYSFYELTDNAGNRRRISTALISGRVEKVGNLFQIKHWPKGFETRAGFPAYLFHPKKRVVRRVGFSSPRTEPVDIKPNKIGEYHLLTPDGYKWYHRDQLFL